jgi:hypothetical protein
MRAKSVSLEELNAELGKFRDAHSAVRQKTNAEGLLWLVAFAQLTPSEIRRDRERISREAREFAYRHQAFGHLPTTRTLSEFAIAVRLGVQSLLAGKPWEIRFPSRASIRRSITQGHVRIRGRWLGRLESQFSADDFRSAFLLVASDVIEATGARLRACARSGCGRFFIRVRRGIYCGERCSQEERNQRFLKAHTKEELRERRRVREGRRRKRKVWKRKGLDAALKPSSSKTINAGEKL